MGVYATARGARVFLSASPARNPGVPEGWTDGEQHGYNGDPAFNVMMSELASAHRWTVRTHARGCRHIGARHGMRRCTYPASRRAA